MEPKHITKGQVTIDIQEYRELVEEASYYRSEYLRVIAELAALRGNANG